MLRYNLAAIALKAFSLNGPTRRLYRWLGNSYGARQRERASIDVYRRRGDFFIDLCDKYDVGRAGQRLLEIGTGWTHWYSLYLRLQRDVRITMVDVWDNRQSTLCKAAFVKLTREWDGGCRTTCGRTCTRFMLRAASKSCTSGWDWSTSLTRAETWSGFPTASSKGPSAFTSSSTSTATATCTGRADGARARARIAFDPPDRDRRPSFALHRSRLPEAVHDLLGQDLAAALPEPGAILQSHPALGVAERVRASRLPAPEKIVETAIVEHLDVDPRWAGYSAEDKSCVIATLVHQRP